MGSRTVAGIRLASQAQVGWKSVALGCTPPDSFHRALNPAWRGPWPSCLLAGLCCGQSAALHSQVGCQPTVWRVGAPSAEGTPLAPFCKSRCLSSTYWLPSRPFGSLVSVCLAHGAPQSAHTP